MRNAAFDEDSHIMPVGSLICGSLTLRKFELPICDDDFSWLFKVFIFDDFIVFLL